MKKILTTIFAGAVMLAFAAPTVWACPSQEDNVQIVKRDKKDDAKKEKVVKKQKDKAKKRKDTKKNDKKKPA